MGGVKLTTKDIDEAAWLMYPYTFRNNRGIVQAVYKTKNGKTSKRFIRYGIPVPPGGGKPDTLKGGDRIGYHITEITPDMVGKLVAIFTSIEIKGPGDRLDPGQIKWHNIILSHGGISEIWTEDEIIKEIIVNV